MFSDAPVLGHGPTIRIVAVSSRTSRIGPACSTVRPAALGRTTSISVLAERVVVGFSVLVLLMLAFVVRSLRKDADRMSAC